MANERNPDDLYRPNRASSNRADDEYRRAARLDTELQPDPELAEGPASTGRIALFAIAVAVVLGVVFVGLAVRAWWRRHHQEKLWQASNKLSADLAHLRPWQAAVLGVIEQPWTLTALAAVVVVSHKSGPLAVVLAFVLFSALSTAGVITGFVYSTVRSDVAENRLDDVKRRLVQIGAIAAAVLSALVGAALIAVGIFGLVTN